MKLLRILPFLVLSLFVAAGCGSRDAIDQFADQFYQAVAAEQIDQAVAMFDVSVNVAGAPSQDNKLALLKMLVGEMGARIKQHGGLKSVKVHDKTMLEEGKAAQATVALKFVDGTLMRDQLNLARVGEEWKIRLD